MKQWLHFALLPLAGFDVRELAEANPLRCGFGVTAACFALSYAYGINALADRASDHSLAKNPLAGSAVAPLGANAAVLAALAGASLTSLGLEPRARWLLVLSLSGATVYSVGLRLKALPVVGTLLNAVIFAPLLALAASDRQLENPALLLLSVAFIGALLQNQLMHEAADAAEDGAGQVLTTARWLGPRWTRFTVLLLTAPFAALAATAAAGAVPGAVATVMLAAGACIPLLEPDWAQARRYHRRFAIAGGGLLFAAGLLS